MFTGIIAYRTIRYGKVAGHGGVFIYNLDKFLSCKTLDSYLPFFDKTPHIFLLSIINNFSHHKIHRAYFVRQIAKLT